jgi:hypothetical protein
MKISRIPVGFIDPSVGTSDNQAWQAMHLNGFSRAGVGLFRTTLVRGIDTAGEIALNGAGDLFISVNGGKLYVLADALAINPCD